MKIVSSVVILVSVVCHAALTFGWQGAAQAPSKPLVFHTVDYLKPPDTLEALWSEGHAVVRVSIQSSLVTTYRTPSSSAGSPRVFTAHMATVNEVLKGDAPTSPIGGVIRIIQSAGEIELADKRIRVRGGFDPFVIGAELVLFLEWNDHLNGYDILYGPSGSFLLVPGQVITFGTQGPAARVKGMRSDEFLAILRKLR